MIGGDDAFLGGSNRGGASGTAADRAAGADASSASLPRAATAEPRSAVDASDVYDPAHELWDLSERCDCAHCRKQKLGEVHSVGSPRKWAVPLLVFLAALFLQNAALYNATYTYIIWMDQMSAFFGAQGAQVTLPSGHVQQGDSAVHNFVPVHQAPLLDNFSAWLGHSHMSTAFFDLISCVIPVVWVFLAVYMKNLRLWSRTLLTGSILAILKGFFAWATVIPDAAGWEGCRARLGDEGLNYFRRKSEQGLSGVFYGIIDVVFLEVNGLAKSGNSHRMRFCADMLFSGQTYMCTLFCLSLFDITRQLTRKHRSNFRTIYRSVVAVSLSLLVLLDSYLALVNRYHYTMDVLVAFVLTLLVYGSPVVAMATEFWLKCGLDPEAVADSSSTDVVAPGISSAEDLGDVVVQPCCLPLCCFQGRYFLYKESGLAIKQRQQEEEAVAEATRQRIETARREQENQGKRVKDIERDIKDLERELERQKQRNKELEEDVKVAATNRQEAVREAEGKYQMELAQAIAKLNQRKLTERAAAEKWQDKVATQMKEYEKLEGHQERERERLVKENERARQEAEEQRRALEALHETVAVEESEVGQLREDAEVMESTVLARGHLQRMFSNHLERSS